MALFYPNISLCATYFVTYLRRILIMRRLFIKKVLSHNPGCTLSFYKERVRMLEARLADRMASIQY